MIELSIFIPTYNRNAVLSENLALLLPQLTSKCRLVIVDNHSDTPVEETLRDLVARYGDRNISILRNRRNIGGNANITRCIELCESNWLWILGDDDRPDARAIEIALQSIRDAPANCVYQNFATPGKFLRDATFDTASGLEHFLAGIDNLGNCLLISSCLFRVGAMSQELMWAFHYAATPMPHLLIAMLTIKRTGGTARFHETSLVTWGDAEQGGRHYVILAHVGCGLLETVPLLNDRERALLRKQISSLLSAKALIAHIAFGRIHGEITYREARRLIARCAAEPHYRFTDNIILLICRWGSLLVFTKAGCHRIAKLVNWWQTGKAVRVQHVSHNI
jgi:glycosyltransferase involved in cell wall biosynthesis